MQRITISLSDSLSEQVDEMTRERRYQSRSEAIRDLVRDGIERWRDEKADGQYCVANLSYIFDRRVRALPQRLAEMQHAHHDLVGVSTIIRLDHYHSIESVILKGATSAVRAFADQVRAERGVRFGAINMLLVVPTDEHHDPNDHKHHGHAHLSPQD